MNRIIYCILFVCLTIVLHSQESNIHKTDTPSVGLVLSGGGAKGFSYVGLLKVLEEVNMPIDYIGGSSIGAIVGALYATGYSPETIEQLIREQDWDALVSDKLEREYISFEEKLFGEKYIFTIPIQDSGIVFSRSLMGSFNIDLMLNDLFSPVAHVSNFSELPIPFLCISTNLLNGEQIILEEGSLSRAIRASMAIPGYFPPIKYQGKYMIDGGVVNNYPAEQIKNLGIDFILGGDVQDGLREDIEDLSSVPAILDQVMTFNRMEANIKGKALTDYFVHIPMPFGMLDFSEYDSIIAIGEEVAREHYSELKAIADSLNELRGFKQGQFVRTQPTDSLKIKDIRLVGMNWSQRERFKGYFEGIDLGKTSVAEIEDRIKLLNGTRSFNELHYELESDKPKEATLDIHANTVNKGSLSAGIHIDNVYKGNIMINMALRNIRDTRAKLFADLILGEYPRLNTMYIVNNGYKPGFGSEFDFFRFGFPIFHDDDRINTWIFETMYGSVFMPMTIRNNFFFRTGVKYELFKFTQDIVFDSTLEAKVLWEDYANLFMEVNYDNRDRIDFPTSGRTVKVKLSHLLPFSDQWNNYSSHESILTVSYNANLSLNDKIVLQPGIFGGYTLIKDDPKVSAQGAYLTENPSPVNHLFGFGGLNPNNYVDNHIPFTGLRYIERLGIYAGKISLNLQYNFHHDLYATLITDIGFNEFIRTNVFKEDFIYGAGIKLSYDSFIGPMEIAIAQSSISSAPVMYLNMGYWF